MYNKLSPSADKQELVGACACVDLDGDVQEWEQIVRLNNNRSMHGYGVALLHQTVLLARALEMKFDMIGHSNEVSC